MPFIGDGGARNGKAHVLEMANRASVQKLATESLSGLTTRLDNHESGLNTNAHGISNIAGLQTALNSKSDVGHAHVISDVTGLEVALDSKQDVIIGATGSFTYVKTVDFVGQTVTTGTINVSNGIVTSIS